MLAAIRAELQALGNPARVAAMQKFFKTGPGEYGEGDRFLCIAVPKLRLLAKRYRDLERSDLAELVASPEHEARLVALLILNLQMSRAKPAEQQAIGRFYLDHLAHVNNWDLVDASAPYLLGPVLDMLPRTTLDKLARSKILWERRVAIVATFYPLRQGDYAPTLRIAERLLSDPHDLIHKAVGWLLREVGKRERGLLVAFLDEHATSMPRTMLRYAIEHFDADLRRHYMRRG